MSDSPPTQYARSGEVSIAYQVLGDGPFDLVFVPGWISHLEHSWEEPALARFLRRLASFSRLILFDKRGTGLSDRVTGLATLEQRTDDVRAVMDAAGSREAVLFGVSEGGPLSALFAANHPERTKSLILYGTFARTLWAPDYPWGVDEEAAEQGDELWINEWGSATLLEAFAPSAAQNERFKDWWSKLLRMGASPGSALALRRMNRQIDIRDALPKIQVPALVLHRRGDLSVYPEETRYVARHIPGAKYVELPGSDHLWWVGDADALIDEVEEFLTGKRPAAEPERVLATMLITDIVSSTKTAAELGNTAWHDVMDSHNATMFRLIDQHRGRFIHHTGDGILAIFDSPERAIKCAIAMRNAVTRLGLSLRSGLHTGTIELIHDLVGGIAVHLAARVMSEAGDDEIWVSRTVKDIFIGTDYHFSKQGMYQLKGIPEEWALYRLEE